MIAAIITHTEVDLPVAATSRRTGLRVGSFNLRVKYFLDAKRKNAGRALISCLDFTGTCPLCFGDLDDLC